MANRLFDGYARIVQGVNRLRKLRTPNVDSSHVQRVLQEYGVNLTDVSVEPIRDTQEGYLNLYYVVKGRVGDREVRYFASKPDIVSEPAVVALWPISGFRYQQPRKRKHKDFDDLTFLYQNGVPSVQPVAFDRKERMVIEVFEEGKALTNYLKNPEYSEDGKLELIRKALLAINGANSLGRYCPDTNTDNFFVTQDGRVILTDMEMTSSLEAGTHDLATLVYSAAETLDPRKIIDLARELHPVETMRKLPKFSRYMLLVSGKRHRTAEMLKGV